MSHKTSAPKLHSKRVEGTTNQFACLGSTDTEQPEQDVQMGGGAEVITDTPVDEMNAPQTELDEEYKSSNDGPEDDEVTQKVMPTAEGELIEAELPKELLDPEYEKFMYPNSSKVVHGDLRGQDLPRYNLLQTDKSNKIDKTAPVKITFRSNSEVLFTAGALRAAQVDKLGVEEGEVYESRKVGVPVKLHWIMHSQLQGFVLQVDRSAAGDKSSEVTVHFHVNNILAAKEGDKLGLPIKQVRP
jgi:hypothetical protein